jgi:hypothetical protein
MLILVPSGGAAVQGRAITGIVFLDQNVNGVRDLGEPGLARVAVSDQAHVVLTDTIGAFELPAGSGYGMVFVSVPDGFRPVGPFWKRVEEDAPVFSLARAPTPREFRFLHASDTHLDSLSLPRTRRLLRLVDSLRPAFVLITGDLIRDALRVSDTVAIARYELFLR